MAIVKNTTAPADQWIAGGVPITMMMNMEKRAGEMKPVIRKALVELDGAPFKEFAAHRDEWARKTAYVYPGPILVLSSTGDPRRSVTSPHVRWLLSRQSNEWLRNA